MVAGATSVALCVLSLALPRGVAQAHGVSVDGSAADWFGTVTATPDLGRIARRADGGGEYVWRDGAGDARAAWPSRPHDLLELRVTGDHARLYVMAKLATPIATSGDSVPQLQLAIDLDHLPNSGRTAFVDSAATATRADAAWERLVQTRFGSGQAPRLLDGQGNTLASGAQASLSAAGVLEVSVPWSDLGLQFVPVNAVRFTAALFLSRASDVPLDPRDGTASRADDVVTQNAGPGLGGTTLGEVADGVADYAFDVWFNSHGEAIAPVVISEVYATGGTKSEWLEVANATQGVVTAGAFKVGDGETPGDAEGMGRLPSGTLLVPGQAFVIARDGATFFTNWGFRADAECDPTDAGTPDQQAFAPWAALAAFNLSNSGDQVLVLDGANTVVDVLVYKNATYPGVIPSLISAVGHSLERKRLDGDTDDCTVDFGDQATPGPGRAAAITAVGDAPARGGGLAWAAPWPNPSRGRVALSLRFPAPGSATIGVYDAAGRLVRRLFDGEVAPGDLRLEWDSRDANGEAAPPGLYFVRAAASGAVATVRLAVVR